MVSSPRVSTTAPAPPTARGRGLVALAVFALAAVPFLGALRAGFLNWDDRGTLLDQDAWRGFSLEHLRWMATSFHMGHHMPLTWLSWALDEALWGLDPFGFHLTNLVLHGLNAVLVFFLAERLLALTTELEPRGVRLGAVFAALFFAVHPLRAESVAWITERRDVLSCAFLLGTVLAYLRASGSRFPVRCQAPGWEPSSGGGSAAADGFPPGCLAPYREPHRGTWLALVLYVLSLLSKAWGITLPVVLLVVDLLVLRRRAGPNPTPWRRLIGEKLLFAPFALASAWLAALAQQHAEAMLDLDRLSLVSRLAQAAYGLCAYPIATLVPLHLGPLYALDPLGRVSTLEVVALVAVVLAVPLVLVLARRRPAVAAAFVSYAILVSPVLGLAQSGVQAWADRYSYLACIPLAIALAAAIRVWAPAATLASFALVLWLGVRTHAQVQHWRDSVSVWSRVVEVEPASYIGHWMLGVSLQEVERHDEALEHLRTALTLRPDDDERLNRNQPGVRYRMAISLFALDRPQEGEATLRAVLAQRPNHPPALDAMRSLLRQRRAYGDLEQLYAAALKAEPELRMAWLGLVDTLLDETRPEDAATVARQALAQLPDDAALHARLGYALGLLQRYEPAETHLRRAIELDPTLVTPRLHLGDVLAARGDLDAARAAWLEARELAPDHAGLADRLRVDD